ncbi:DUF6894 family protein [Methylobacterium brachythecii]|uniref:DUF6894 domain-containing protein n=1 Tax=Methylobacterium brachythecii TaxID=1176177 RepID=A0A7W6AH67_9HYPH|nr:hypothetical protein [Methylobacterium brachythecii]MBB3901124.1 hypothetical protein [Methylobacterium brachythecii]
MPRFYFDIHDGATIRDEIGRVLTSREEVRREALKVALKLLAAEAEDARETALVLTVRDEAGGVSLRIRVVSQVEEH